MQKKRLPSKVLSIVLALLMMLTVIPLVPSTTADAKYATEYYYPAGTKFIKNFVITYYKNSTQAYQNAEQAANTNGAGVGYGICGTDLTKGTGGDYYVYVAWSYTYNPNEAVRGVKINHASGTSYPISNSGVNWYPINSGVHNWVPQLHSDGCVDLNKGAGGDDLTLYITKDVNYGPPITNFTCKVDDSSISSGWYAITTLQDGRHLDVNAGASGNYLYLSYTHNSTVVDTTSLRNAYNNSAAYDGAAGYTPASSGALSEARNTAKTIIDAFDSSVNQGSTTYTQSEINNAAYNITNSLNNLKTYLYLDAGTNGGSPANQTVEVTVGTNTQAQVNLDNYPVSKEGADFVGWADSALAREGKTGTVTVGFNQKFYALFGVQLTANFHYLLPDGTLKKEVKQVYAMNAATAASTPKPTLKDATVDGSTFSPLGWRTDTVAGEATIGKTGVQTIYTEEPVINLYAVYSSPITFTHDSNKGAPTIDVQSQTQYLNANTEITKTAHDFYVTDTEIVREGGTFLGWADSTTATEAKYFAGDKFTVTENTTIYAAYEMIFNTVTFVDGNGNVMKTQAVPYGDDAVAPEETPVKNYDADNHYVYTAWDTIFTEVKTDLTVTAQFDTIPHEYDIETTLEPTCTEEGSEQWTCECTFTKAVPTAALGHNMAVDPGNPATCTQDGYTDYISCLRCLVVLEERVIIPKLGHDYELYSSFPAYCAKGGYDIYVCANNSEHREIRNLSNPTGEHSYVTVKGEAATCTVSGYTESVECSICRSVKEASTVILATGHKLVTDKAVAPTCEETGLTEGKHCSECDYVVEQTEVAALGHDWKKLEAKDATCTEDGYTEGFKCRRCHTTKDSEVIAAGHDYVETVVPVTCTKDGYTLYVCSKDKTHTYTVEGEAALGHKGGEATCSAQAVCTECGESYGETLEHNYESQLVESTCTVNGYTLWTCTGCGDSYKTDELELAAHNYDNGVVTTEATCTENGVITYTCDCGDSYTDDIDALGHDVNDWTVANGMATGTCTDCGETIETTMEDAGVEPEECERCGMVHTSESGIYKYKGIYCNIINFFRQIINFFKGNA